MTVEFDVNYLPEIHKAAYSSTLKDIETEINAENIKAYCMYGLTPLHWAIKSYRLDNIKILIKKSKELNVDIVNIPHANAGDKKSTPIVLALDKLDILKILIENGADFKDLKIDEDGNTILHKAVSDYIANKNDTHTYLIIAILKCAPEAAKIKNNKDENAWDLIKENNTLKTIFTHFLKDRNQELDTTTPTNDEESLPEAIYLHDYIRGKHKKLVSSKTTHIDIKTNKLSPPRPSAEELRKKRLEKFTHTQTPVSLDNAITTPINDEKSLPEAIYLHDRIEKKPKKSADSEATPIDIKKNNIKLSITSTNYIFIGLCSVAAGIIMSIVCSQSSNAGLKISFNSEIFKNYIKTAGEFLSSSFSKSC